MIIYDSKIARLLQGRLNPYDYVTLPIVTLIALPYGEIGIWEEMEMRIHRRQYAECFLASLLPSLLLGWQVCWGFACHCSLTTSFTGLNAWLSAIQRLTTRQKKRARK
jgi:hypothetical protein